MVVKRVNSYPNLTSFLKRVERGIITMINNKGDNESP